MLLLVAGDKSGNWQRWYDVAIPLAEARYAEHLAALTEEGERDDQEDDHRMARLPRCG